MNLRQESKNVLKKKKREKKQTKKTKTQNNLRISNGTALTEGGRW